MSQAKKPQEVLFEQVAAQVGIPSPSEFKTEEEADAALGSKLVELEDEAVAAFTKAGYDLDVCWDVLWPKQFEAKGWRVSHDETGSRIHTEDVEKAS